MDIGFNHISVCICTYKRPELLESLLNKLQDQRTGGLFRYSLLVVDNDDEQSARTVVEHIKKNSSIPLHYYVEPKRNIALARNKAIVNANGNFVAFIDDDELPMHDWLLSFYVTLNEYKADGVLGPVMPHFKKDPPEWIIRGKLCERPTHATGTVMHWGNTRTGNVLMKKKCY